MEVALCNKKVIVALTEPLKPIIQAAIDEALKSCLLVCMLLLREHRRTNDLLPICSVFHLLQGSENSEVEGERSFSTMETHVEHGLPFRRFQSRSILSRSTRDVSHSRSNLAT